MSIILREKVHTTSLASETNFLTFGREGKIMIDLRSAGTRPIEIVDNNSNHTPTASGETYRITTEAHNEESCGTLYPQNSVAKVDQLIPSLFNLQTGLAEGEAVILEVVTSSGTKEMSVTRNRNSLLVTLTGFSGTISVPITPKLFTTAKNVYGKYADLARALLMVIIRYSGFQFCPAKVEDKKAFKKLMKTLWLI